MIENIRKLLIDTDYRTKTIREVEDKVVNIRPFIKQIKESFENRIEKLNKLKKGLLQKMFI